MAVSFRAAAPQQSPNTLDSTPRRTGSAPRRPASRRATPRVLSSRREFGCKPIYAQHEVQEQDELLAARTCSTIRHQKQPANSGDVFTSESLSIL
ncbi:hypothetical protein PR003_g33453 [Phytophthora rubi]|uniref:Uncharacterized protein n=1 Tax=Phytophthora rubi TaxID=129364 RepID=A0A6A4ATH7_9STRA|nr:hypothetical protein PR003_g33453 [Phytophthora rubi]